MVQEHYKKENGGHSFTPLLDETGKKIKDFINLNGEKTLHLYQKKQILFYEGNPTTGIYYVHSGRVKVYKIGLEGKHHILNIAESDSILGLESILAGECYSSTAEMIEEGKVAFIEKQTFFDLIHEHPLLAFQVMKTLAKGIVSSETERVDLAQCNVRERMARLLTLLCKKHGIPEDHGIRINLKLSREEMAEMIGTAIETAMRLLKELKDEKVVELEGKQIIILDQKRLVQNANLIEEVL